jgi:hypothetical protein
MDAGPSANDEFSDAPYLLASLQPDGHGPGADVVHHYCTGLVNSISHLANADRADSGIPVQPCQCGIVRPGRFASNQAGAVLQRRQAARIEPAGQLVDRADSRQHFHGGLNRPAGDGTHLGQLINGPQTCRSPGLDCC